MRFTETATFTAQAQAIGDEALLALQKFLIEQPEAGDVIPGTGGLRKVRVRLAARGKSGGARAIYLLLPARPVIVLMYLYAKSDKTDLSPAEKKVLRAAAEVIKANQHKIP